MIHRFEELNIKSKLIDIYNNVVARNLLINLFVLVLFLVIGPRYEAPDDTAMEHILSGFSSEPSSYLVFINVILGKILLIAYKVFPRIKWYLVFTYLILFISLLIISIIIDESIRGVERYLIKYPLLILVGYDIYDYVQFTKTAAIVTISGAILVGYIVSCELKRCDINHKKLKFLFACLVIYIGTMIRFDAALLCAPFIFLIFIAFLKDPIQEHIQNNNGEWVKYICGVCIKLSILLLIILFSKCLDNYYYDSKPDWKSYREYNVERAKVTDCYVPEYEEQTTYFGSIGLSENDYYMVRNWMFGDTDYYNTDMFTKVAESGKDRISVMLKNKSSLKKVITKVFENRTDERMYILLIYILFLYVICSKKTILSNLIVLSAIMIDFILLFYFSLIDRVISRVNFIIWIGTFFTVIFLMRCGEEVIDYEIKRAIKTAVVISGVVVILNLNGYISHYDIIKDEYISSEKYKERTLSIAEDKNTVFVNDVCNNIFDKAWGGIWDKPPKGVCFNNVISMAGWSVYSPSWLHQLFQNSIVNIFADSIDDSRILFITTEDRKNRIETYINEHYNAYARVVKAYEFNDGINYYKVVTHNMVQELDQSMYENDGDLSDVFHYVRITDDGDNYYIDGTVYVEGESSLSQKVYIVVNNSDEELYSMRAIQKESASRQDNFEGQYGNFELMFPKDICEINTDNVYVVLVSSGKMYKLQIDDIL